LRHPWRRSPAAPHEPPSSITDAELETYLQARVDAAWVNTGLEGRVERPQLTGDSLAQRFRSGGFGRVSECMQQSGIDSWE